MQHLESEEEVGHLGLSLRFFAVLPAILYGLLTVVIPVASDARKSFNRVLLCHA